MNIQDIKPTTRSGIFITLVTLSLIFVDIPFATADSVTTPDRFEITLGSYFVTHTDGLIRLDDTTGPINLGTSIDWSSDLHGSTSVTAPRVTGYYRFNDKNRIDFGWYAINRSGENTLQRDIDFGDKHYPAGTTVNSNFDSDITKLLYTYSFYHAPEIETSVSVGLHVTRSSFSLNSSVAGLNKRTVVTAPLPVIGFRMDYKLSQKWQVRTVYDLFFLDNSDQYSGSLTDFTLAIEHSTFRHVGFGGGIERTSLDASVSGTNKEGAYSSVLNGIMLYVVVR